MTTNWPEKLDEALIRPGRVDHQVAFGNATQTQIEELFERMYTNDLPKTKFVKAASASAVPNGNAKSTLAPVKEKEDILTPPIAPTTASYEHSNGHAINGDAKPPTSPVSPSPSASTILGEKHAGEVGEEELKTIARDFSLQVPDDMFSPAQIQGFLLKRKMDPRRALAEVGAWVEGMEEVRRRGTRVLGVQ